MGDLWMIPLAMWLADKDNKEKEEEKKKLEIIAKTVNPTLYRQYELEKKQKEEKSSGCLVPFLIFMFIIYIFVKVIMG